MTGTRLVLRGVTIFLLSSTMASAQAVSTAQITGTVRDQAGLVLPGVTITVVQTDTGLTRTTVTDDGGSYVLQNLPIGPYRLQATLQGFRPFEQTGIVLEVGANPTLPITLTVGQVQETISVEANALLVETRNPGIGQVITNQQVLQLPLNGRQLTELIFQAGVAAGGASTTAAPGANTLNTGVRNYPTVTIQVAGGTSNGLTYILDGGTHNDPFNNLNQPLPFPDAMQEFKVETSALPAQYGHHSAAAVNAVTKSGTNVVHGGVFEFLRDDSLNAKNAFAAIGRDGQRRSDGLHRDQFGGTIGGPVVLGKLFYFAGYQGTRIKVTPTDSFAFVPTAAMLAGNFAAVASPACNAGRTMTLTAPFVNDTVSPALFSPAALNLAKKLPQPVDECGRTLFDRKNERTENMFIGRIDYQWSNSHSIFGRYELAHLGSQPDADPNKNLIAYANSPLDHTVNSVVVGDTYLFGPNTVNSFRATYNDADISKSYVHFFDVGQLGVQNFTPLLPDYYVMSVAGGFGIGGNNTNPGSIPTKVYQVADDLSLVRSAHQIGMGVNFIHSSLSTTSYGSASGSFTFSGQITGLGLADFLLGRPTAIQQTSVNHQKGTIDYLALYVQDAWKATPNLTLNVGLRWQPYLPYTSGLADFSHFSMDNFRAGVRSTVYRNAPAGLIFVGDPGYPGNAVGDMAWDSLAPRVAAAWDVRGDGRMTVRAAYGRFYETPHLFNYFGFTRSSPFGNTVTINNGTFDNPWGSTPGGNPFPITPNANTIFPPSGTYVTHPFDMKPPYADQWNVSVQRQLGGNWMVSANYLSSRGHRLPIGDQLNPAVFGPGATTANTAARRVLTLENPDQGRFYGQIFEARPIGTSQYDALLLSTQHRAANGLFLSGNYTLSKCVSDLVDYVMANGQVDLVKPGDAAYDRGSCGSTDQRHVVNLSAVYQVPRLSSGLGGALTKDWQVSAIVAARGGTRFNVTTGVDNALTGQANQRPDQVMDNVYLKDGYRWLNPAAFRAPAPGTYGNLVVNTLVGPRYFNVDMGLVRSFSTGGQRQFQFRAEVFNLLNRTHLDLPVSVLNSPNFGLITNTAADARIVQLAVKYVF
jgi:carboxypeptidase family protein/TonB-dependent receptor-like protein